MFMLNRRTMLGQSMAVAAGAAFSRVASAADSGSRKFTLDLRCGSIGVKADQIEAIRLAGQHGFESVTPEPSYLSQLDEGQREALQTLMNESKLAWGAAGLPVDVRLDESEYRQQLKRLPELAAGMQRCGVTRVGTWVSPSHDELTYMQNFKRHAKRYRQCAQILSDHGQRFGLEYIGPKTLWASSRHAFVHTMEECKELIAAIGVDNMGFILDSWHWYTAHETVDDLLTLTNDDVVACDLNDAPKGREIDEQIDNRRELPMATGVIDLKGFLGALVKIGYDGPVRAEPFNAELNAMENEPAVAATAKAMKEAFALVS